MPVTERDWRRLLSVRRIFEIAFSGFCAILIGGASQIEGVDRNPFAAYAWWVWRERTTDPDWRGAIKRYVESSRASAWRDGRDLMITPTSAWWADIREDALIRYVGTLLARINPGRYPRLRAALRATTTDARRRELAERLPGAVYQALASGSANADPSSVRSRAVTKLEHESSVGGFAAISTRARRDAKAAIGAANINLDVVPRREYRPRRHRRDGEQQDWPKRPAYDPLPTVIALLNDGMWPESVDQDLREEGLGTLWDLLDRLPEPIRAEIRERLRSNDQSDPASPVGGFAARAAREEAATEMHADILDCELTKAAAALAKQAGLTAREIEVFLLSENLTHRQIAERLGISRNTAKAHRFHIKEKMTKAGLLPS
jgi:DNA-binding CsgD family transcriptional regulator